jgi:hypothetical protein
MIFVFCRLEIIAQPDAVVMYVLLITIIIFIITESDISGILSY